jgi:translation initiation factor 4E
MSFSAAQQQSNNNNNNRKVFSGEGDAKFDVGTSQETNDNNNVNDPNLSATNNNKQPHLPLQYAWTLWHTEPSQGGGWTEHYKQIAQFSTVEEFWRLFNNISPPSLLAVGSSYHLFKGKVKPAWEDAFNKNGGSWAFRFSNFQASGKNNPSNYKNKNSRNNNKHSKYRNISHAANYAWYHTVLNMIGNNFKYSEDICGLIINIKQNNRGKIELWIKDANDRERVMDIGRQFKHFSFSGPSKAASTDIEFLSFADQMSKNRSKKIKL